MSATEHIRAALAELVPGKVGTSPALTRIKVNLYAALLELPSELDPNPDGWQSHMAEADQEFHR